MILLHGWVKRNSTKNCVDTSVKITGRENSVIQKTKRLTFRATLIVSLVKEKDLLLMKFSPLNSNLFCWKRFCQRGTQSEPEKNPFIKLMHKKAVSVGSRMWMRMSFSKLFKGYPINSVRLLQCPHGFWKRFQKWFYLL